MMIMATADWVKDKKETNINLIIKFLFRLIRTLNRIKETFQLFNENDEEKEIF